jgi:hypothetical protein
MLFFLAFHFSISLTPNCRNWSPNYSVLVLLNKASRKVRSGQVSLDKRVGVSSFFGRKGGGSSLNFDPAQPMGASKRRQRKALPPPSPQAEGAREMLSTPPPPFLSRTRQPVLLPRVKKKKKRRSEPKPAAAAAAQAEGEQEAGAAALLRRAARAAKAAAKTAQLEPWLDAWTNMGMALYGRTEEPPIAGDELSEENDPSAVAEGAAARLMPQQTRDTRSSQSAGPPEQLPWTFGGTYWLSRASSSSSISDRLRGR